MHEGNINPLAHSGNTRLKEYMHRIRTSQILFQQGISRQAIHIMLLAGSEYPGHGLRFFTVELPETCRIRGSFDQAPAPTPQTHEFTEACIGPGASGQWTVPPSKCHETMKNIGRCWVNQGFNPGLREYESSEQES